MIVLPIITKSAFTLSVSGILAQSEAGIFAGLTGLIVSLEYVVMV
jgi:hypothetical protein